MAKRKTHAESGLPPELRDDYEPLPGEIVASGTDPAEPANERSHVQRMSLLSDVLTGVRFYFNYEKHRGEISFEAKPEQNVRTFLSQNGYDWDRDAKVWAYPIHFPNREADRLQAKRVFHQVVTLVRKEKGIQASSQPLPD